MVTTVTDNSPQSINTSLFSLDRDIQEVKKVTDKLKGLESDVISVNGKQGIVELNASDVGALPDTTFIPEKTSDLTNDSGFVTMEDVAEGYVPLTRTINDKTLDEDITLDASDVGALPDTTVIPTKTSELTNDSGFITSSDSITGNAATATRAEQDADGNVITDTYATKTELDNKSDIGHNHDDRYYTESEIDSKLANKVDKVNGKGLSTNDYTTAEKNKLAGLSNYDDGAVKTLIANETKAREDADKALQTAIDGKAAASHTHTKSQITDFAHNHDDRYYTESEINEKIYDINEKIGTLQENKNDLLDMCSDLYNKVADEESSRTEADTALQNQITSNKSAIDTLNGTGEGSVQKTVTDEIAKVVANAPGDFDTLKEISDWIDTHEDSASAMNTAISTNATNLSNHTNNKSNPHSVTKAQVGLGNVGNFKAVSTVASQGLTDTEKSNARTNIGAGTSSFSGSYNDLTDKPSSFTPASHNHSASDITSGTLPIARGGTGQTTQAGINKAIVGGLSEGTSDVTDGTMFVSSYASDNGFGDTNATNVPYKRKFSHVWNYIKGKADSVYAKLSHTHTKSQITDFAHTHDDRYYTESEIDTKLAGKANSSHTHDYLPLSGGAMTGNIQYKGSKATLDMIKFIDNADDVYGNGIVIGGGGLTIIGGGESSNTVAIHQTSGGDEKMIIANDYAIDFYTNTQTGFPSAKHITMNTDGTITANGFNGKASTAGTADKATQDASGNVITDTYATKTALSSGLSGKSDTGHTHDDRYYTESEMNTKLAAKADSSHTHTKSQITDFAHNHDDRYYTETEIDTKLAGYMPKSGGTFTGIVTGTEFHARCFYPKNNIDSGYGFEENANGETYLRLISNNAMTIDSPKGIDINGEANHSGIILTREGSFNGATVSIGQNDGNVTIGDPDNENNGYTVINNDCKMLHSLNVDGGMSVKGGATLNGSNILTKGNFSFDETTATLTITM